MRTSLPISECIHHHNHMLFLLSRDSTFGEFDTDEVDTRGDLGILYHLRELCSLKSSRCYHSIILRHPRTHLHLYHKIGRATWLVAGSSRPSWASSQVTETWRKDWHNSLKSMARLPWGMLDKTSSGWNVVPKKPNEF